MKTSEIRNIFLKYFEKLGHKVVESSSLVPGNDPTLLFTNAGMVQFKDVFLGLDKRDYTKAASSQRCVRAGGKHNDLENVGFTARHHTFFEMLGNFSFGDYFKKEAIKFAYDFITKELKIPAEKLWFTVFKDDEEAAKIWLDEIGIDENRLSYCGEKDNFWSMGDTGPCGPCSEIFYDHGPEIAGGPPGSPDEDGDRYIEIWNLVFMQYDRDKNGNLKPLPKPSVDTGMGLERVAAVMQNEHNNYSIDLFKNLIDFAVSVIKNPDRENSSYKVIVDHLRSCSFLVADGVLPSNEGRGYVLRRIMRRAIRHGHKLGVVEEFFYKLVPSLVKEMGDAYPLLIEKEEQIEKAFKREEQQFNKTLTQGLKILDEAIDELHGKIIPGDVVFKLYDTYGFPVDLTQTIAKEKNLDIDIAGFEECMEAQRHRAREASSFSQDAISDIKVSSVTEFVGYEDLETKAKVLDIFKDGVKVDSLRGSDKGVIVLDKTPFYAESGGQVGDRGEIVTKSSVFRVDDTKKSGKAHLHIGFIEDGEIKIGDEVEAKVISDERQAIIINHSATHLMHAALQKVLGSHVEQKGSLVDAKRTRFDFSHPSQMTREEIIAVENLVNEQIRKNTKAHIEYMNIDDAKKKGAMALFGEKYDETVRVLSMGGDFSVELCGGTHAKRTGDIGYFKIIGESGVAAGVRRIEAITGQNALDYINFEEQKLNDISKILKCSPDIVLDKVSQLQKKIKVLEKEVTTLKTQMVSGNGSDILDNVQEINGVKVLSIKVPVGDPKSLREMVDNLKNKLGTGVVVLGAENNNKAALICGVTKDLTETISAGELVGFLAEKVGGKGGGRKDMAQAGGDKPENLEKALRSVVEWLDQRI